MPQVQAAQHIYANVEATESPRHRGGFQTLYHSLAALTPSEVSEMEGRLLYYPSDISPVKRLCFTLSTGRPVVGQIVPIAEEDSAGRKGRYLAHSLIFAPHDYERIACDPFALWDGFAYAVSVKDALVRGDFQSGDIAAAALDVADSPADAERRAQEWTPNALAQLVLLALRAAELARQRLPVAVVGSPDEVEQTVRAVWCCLPTALRPFCSFDTYFHRCNLVATYYWAVGLKETPANPNLPVVDARARCVIKTPFTNPQTAYETWICAQIAAGALEQVAVCRDAAFAVCEFLDGHNSDAALADVAPAELVDSIFGAVTATVDARLRERLAADLPSSLLERAFPTLRSQFAGSAGLEHLHNGYQHGELTAALWQSYTDQRFPEPSRAERKELEEFLTEDDDPRLHFLRACWSGDRAGIQRLIGTASADLYTELAAIALRRNLAAPALLISGEHGDRFLDVYLNQLPHNAAVQADIPAALIDAGQPQCLARLTPWISQWSPRDVQAVRKRIEGVAGVPSEFQEALAAQADAGADTGLRGLVGRWLGRRPQA